MIATPELWLQSIRYSADGGHVMSLGQSCDPFELVYSTHDVTTGQLIDESRAMADRLFRTAFSLDGRVAASAGGEEVRIWNIS